MKQRHITLAKILTYSGTLPLIASAASIYMHMHGFDSVRVAQTYSAMILSFLSGIHWAVYLFFAEKCPRNLLVTSNAVALIAWASVLVTYQPITLIVQALCFLYILMLDVRLRDAGLLPLWFYGLRRNATLIVMLCLIAIALS